MTMNERMIELYREASEFAYTICREEGRAGGPSDHIWNTLSTGKFAELIVAECCVALHPMLRDMISRTQAVDMIVEHFRDKE